MRVSSKTSAGSLAAAEPRTKGQDEDLACRPTACKLSGSVFLFLRHERTMEGGVDSGRPGGDLMKRHLIAVVIRTGVLSLAVAGWLAPGFSHAQSLSQDLSKDLNTAGKDTSSAGKTAAEKTAQGAKDVTKGAEHDAKVVAKDTERDAKDATKKVTKASEDGYNSTTTDASKMLHKME
jgi:hypothetical protein